MIIDELTMFKQLIFSVSLQVPRRTGELASSIERDVTSEPGYEIYRLTIGGNDEAGEKGYYMPYTNERWISPRWHGRKNPNEQWWQNAITKVGKLYSTNNEVEYTRGIFGKFNL